MFVVCSARIKAVPSYTRSYLQLNLRQKHYALTYKYVPDILAKRDAFRAEHLKNIKFLNDQKKIIIGGALLDPVDSGLIIFDVENKEQVEAFVKNDPYYKNKLVTAYTIREMAVVTKI